ncbi:MAG TPA: serine/threonine-protein kinase, partial [Blastocatellia bacterium]|nr:serine/threonine-protein kinase [Blastocatellia bacterium]
MNCPNCQQTLESNARFCITCGLIFIGTTLRNNQRPAANTATVVKPAKADPLIGRTLDGKYELLARLGQGGMGTVYRARRVHIGDEVAVKVLHQNYSNDDDVLARFRREAQAAATLRHPNVVTIYDYSETREDAMAYLVMEFVPGVPLGYLLKDGNRLSLERAVALMRHICAGVGAAHQRQIVHRDLKPDNIIVIPTSYDNPIETVKVVDFGIAKLRDMAATQALTETGMIIGTPFYMSPEQCRGEELDARSDVYSLGVMFYEMIAGMRPFNAPTPTGVIAKHLTQAPPPLHATLKIPATIEATLMRALAKDPSARQANALAFARALESALQQSVPARPTHDSGTPQFTLPARSHSARKALVVTAALCSLLVITFGLLTFRFATQPASQKAQQPVPSSTRVVAKATPAATATPKAIPSTPRA